MSDKDPYGQQPTPYGQPPTYGEPPQSPYGAQQPAPYGQPYGQQPTPYGTQPQANQPYGAAYPGGRDPDKRPGTVTAAGITTIVMSGLVLLCGLLFVVVGLAMDTGEFYDSFRDSAGSSYDDFSNEEIGLIIAVIGGVLVVWCAISMLLGVLVMRRSNVARILLAISAGAAVLFSLIAILSIISAIPFLAAIAVLIMLFAGGANDWFARRGSMTG